MFLVKKEAKQSDGKRDSQFIGDAIGWLEAGGAFAAHTETSSGRNSPEHSGASSTVAEKEEVKKLRLGCVPD